MAVSNELQRPAGEEDFEAMCCELYTKVWSNARLMRVGRSGEAQFGVDILGHDGHQSVGIQCKAYTSTKFTLSTVTEDVDKADQAGLEIKHLVFATTASSKAETVRSVHALSERRRASGKFTVSVEFWNTICGHIRLHPEIGRAFIPSFPGSTLLTAAENIGQVLAVVESNTERQDAMEQRILDAIADLPVSKPAAAPDARGDESDPGVVASLDYVRDRLREGKTTDALSLLKALDPDTFKDQYSKFRWHTNAAAIAGIEGDEEHAAEEFQRAFQFAPDDPKAHLNRVHAYFVRGKFEAADVSCDEALARFPDNPALWGLRLHIRAAVGREVPEMEIPESVNDSADFLFSKSRLLGTHGDHRGALALLDRCIELDGGSLDARRSLLAEALAWAAVDNVAAFIGELPNEKQVALAAAVSKFEPLEQTLPSIQANTISEELATNITSSLAILKDKPRARRIAHQLLSRHPNLEQLLRIHLNELAEHDKVDKIHALTDHRLDKLSSPILAMLAEISAQRGDVAWNNSIMSVASLRYEDDEKLRSIDPIRFLAIWHAGESEHALAGLQEYLGTHSENNFARVLEAEFLRGLGKFSEALAVAKACKERLSPNDISLDSVHVADLLFRLKAYNDALPLLRRLVATPGGNELTWKLAVCLVNTDRRREAQRLFDAMPADARSQTQFRRVETNLAGSMGDWGRLRTLLEAELTANPRSSECIVGYADALFRMGDLAALKEFVAKDPILESSTAEQELAFAKFQMHCGFGDAGVLRLYRLYRSRPNSEKTAAIFLGQLLLAQQISLLAVPEIVGPFTAVHLRRGEETWTVAIDRENDIPVESWPELVSPVSEIARKLLGRRPGDEVTLRRGLSDDLVQIVGIGPLIGFAAEKARVLIANSTNSDGPLWSVRIVKDDGAIDIDLLLRSAIERRAHAEELFKLYAQHRLPLCVLAKLMGTDPIKLLLEWPSQLAPLFIGFGSEDERQLSFRLVEQGGRFVVDLLTIAELVRHGVAGTVQQLIGRPLIAQTHREQLLVMLAATDGKRESANLGEVDGRLQITPIPLWYFERRKRLLMAMLSFVDSGCEVVPTSGPEELTEAHQNLRQVLDPSTMDSIYLCLEHKATLLTEDGGLRVAAVEAGVSMSTNIQPLLMVAWSRGLITKKRYAEVVSTKLLARHDFVSVNALDLMEMALETPNRIAAPAKAAIESFRSSTLQIESGVKVSVDFIRSAAERLPPSTFARYIHLILDAICHERPQLERLLTRYLYRFIRHLFGRNGRKLSKQVRREFGKRLLKRR